MAKTRPGIHEVKGGNVVENDKGHKFSKNPQSHEEAMAQLRAIQEGIHKHKVDQSKRGGK
jgi:hypothetical protein